MESKTDDISVVIEYGTEYEDKQTEMRQSEFCHLSIHIAVFLSASPSLGAQVGAGKWFWHVCSLHLVTPVTPNKR
jgi:hypothetical protein